MKKGYFIMGFVVILGAIVLLSFNNLSRADVPKKEELGIPVEVGEIILGSIKDERNYIGTLKSKNEVLLAFKQPGFITKLFIKEGSNFKKGDILTQLDADELLIKKELAQQKMKSAELNAEHLKDLLDKNTILYEAGAVPKQSIEDLTLKYIIAKNTIEEAAISIKEIDLMLNKSSIYAPYDGVVREILKKVGEYTQPGQPILQVSQKDDLIAEIAVLERDLQEITIGSKALIYLSNNEVVNSRVTEIANYLNPQTKTANIQIPVISDSKLLPNMSVKISIINKEKENAFLIPANAVVDKGEKQYVYCYENGIAQQKEVKLGINAGNLIEVLSGIELTDKIIISNLQELTNNSRVFIYKGVD
ncbi:MAG: hypothetical protein JM58_19410 [Peptococcaceae bacterium BICA1-8]|nr:MAG: hypothetical protein JM58_19410 [Peptococcaceae bacterium BICA1-8]